MPVDIEAQAGIFLRRAIEMVLALTTALFGLLLILFPSAMQTGLYDPMLTLLPERAWAALMFGIGSTRFIVLVINGFWPLSPMARIIYSAVSLAAVWLPFAVCFLVFFKQFLLGTGGGLLPGLVLTGISVFAEALCIFVLMALREARKRTP